MLSLITVRSTNAETLLILGDSLSAGYQLPVQKAWPSLLAAQWKKDNSPLTLVNGSISGSTTSQGLSRLPELLKQHQPEWVLVELGANDALRGRNLADTRRDLDTIIGTVKKAGATPILMQIKIPPNYGKRYTERFEAIYPHLAQQHNISLLPFFMEEVIIKPEWMLQDGIHPNADAQPFITTWMQQHLTPLLKEQ